MILITNTTLLLEPPWTTGTTKASQDKCNILFLHSHVSILQQPLTHALPPTLFDSEFEVLGHNHRTCLQANYHLSVKQKLYGYTGITRVAREFLHCITRVAREFLHRPRKLRHHTT